MKCRTYKCKAHCCYNVPFENGELEAYADKIVNPVIDRMEVLGAVVPLTSDSTKTNKCPFLRTDYKCNIYENRPDICRKFGQIDKLKCNLIKR